MNRSRVIIAIAVAIVLGLVVSSIVYKALTRPVVQTTVAPSTPHVDLVVASSRLPLGWRLQPSQVHIIQWPGTSPLPGSFSRVEDVVGRALIAPTVENEPILEGKLAPREGGAGLPARIPEGMRAVSVAVNDVVSVAGFVQPGTMVDVLVTAASAAGSNTRTILENVRVLATGQRIEQDADGQPQSSSVVTLLVSPEDAGKLTMASTEGRIQLALRNVIDTGKVEPPPVYSAALFGGSEAPVSAVRHTGGAPTRSAAPPPPSIFSIEVIRGSKREVDNFPNP